MTKLLVNIFTLIECHVNLDIEGFEDRDPNGEITGIKLPYIVTVDAQQLSTLMTIYISAIPAVRVAMQLT